VQLFHNHAYRLLRGEPQHKGDQRVQGALPLPLWREAVALRAGLARLCAAGPDTGSGRTR
jgi:hypothetical protein